jgi:hypothetical protein
LFTYPGGKRKMFAADKPYYIDRESNIKISVDTNNIESECQVITFFNSGDVGAFIKVVGGILRYIEKNQQVSFGTDIPNIRERAKFNVTFDGAGNTEVQVERANYKPDC